MAIYVDRRGGSLIIERQVRGVLLKRATGLPDTPKGRKTAELYDSMIDTLIEGGRIDVVRAIQSECFTSLTSGRTSARATGSAPRTRRPVAPRTIERYQQSWQRFFVVLTAGRDSRLDDLTKGFLATYCTERKQAGAAPATVTTATYARSRPSGTGVNTRKGSP